jgi:hypothetical protein
MKKASVKDGLTFKMYRISPRDFQEDLNQFYGIRDDLENFIELFWDKIGERNYNCPLVKFRQVLKGFINHFKRVYRAAYNDIYRLLRCVSNVWKSLKRIQIGFK